MHFVVVFLADLNARRIQNVTVYKEYCAGNNTISCVRLTSGDGCLVNGLNSLITICEDEDIKKGHVHTYTRMSRMCWALSIIAYYLNF
jgi:hypothetical protein